MATLAAQAARTLPGSGCHCPPFQHLTQEYRLVCIQSGTTDLQYRNTRGQAGDEMFVVIEPGEICLCQSKGCTYYCLHMDPAWLQQFVTEQFQREPSWPHFPSHPLFDPSLSWAVRALAVRSLSPVSRLQQDETLLSLLAQVLLSHAQDAGVLPQLGREHPAVKRTKEYLQAHYAQEVALQELAGVGHMSPFHLARVFRQTVGVPPHAYQTKLRLEHARTLLAQGYDVGYVAQETGFSDQSHFTWQFKRYYLLLPGSYRKTARFF